MQSTITSTNVNNNYNEKIKVPLAEDRSEERMDDTSTWVYPLTEKQLNIIRDRMISPEVYDAMDADSQQYYNMFVPATDSIKTLLNFLRKMGVFTKLLAPIFEILNNLPSPNPLEQVVTIMKLVNSFFDIISKIRSLRDVPIIGQLAAPVLDIFLIVWDILVSIILLIFALIDGKLFTLLFTGNYLKRLKEQANEFFGKDTLKELQSVVKGFQNKSTWENIEAILGKKETNKLKKEILKAIKPVFDIIDTFEKIADNITAMYEFLETLHPLSEKSSFNAVCKFMFGRTAREMFQGSKELNKKMAGPLKLMDDIADGINNVSKVYYISKDDKQILEAHNKKVKELEQKKKKSNNFLEKEIDEATESLINSLIKIITTIQKIKIPDFDFNFMLDDLLDTLLDELLSIDPQIELERVLKLLKETPDINNDLINALEQNPELFENKLSEKMKSIKN